MSGGFQFLQPSIHPKIVQCKDSWTEVRRRSSNKYKSHCLAFKKSSQLGGSSVEYGGKSTAPPVNLQRKASKPHPLTDTEESDDEEGIVPAIKPNGTAKSKSVEKITATSAQTKPQKDDISGSEPRSAFHPESEKEEERQESWSNDKAKVSISGSKARRGGWPSFIGLKGGMAPPKKLTSNKILELLEDDTDEDDKSPPKKTTRRDAKLKPAAEQEECGEQQAASASNPAPGPVSPAITQAPAPGPVAVSLTKTTEKQKGCTEAGGSKAVPWQ